MVMDLRVAGSVKLIFVKSRSARASAATGPLPRLTWAVGKMRRVLCQDQRLAGPQYQFAAVTSAPAAAAAGSGIDRCVADAAGSETLIPANRAIREPPKRPLTRCVIL